MEERKLSITRRVDEKRGESVRKYKEYKEEKKSWDDKSGALEAELRYYKKKYLEEYKQQHPNYKGGIRIERVREKMEAGRWVAHSVHDYFIEAKSPEYHSVGMVVDSFISYGKHGSTTYHFVVIQTNGEVRDYNFYNKSTLEESDKTTLYLSETEPGSLALKSELQRPEKMPLCTYEKSSKTLYIHPDQEKKPAS